MLSRLGRVVARQQRFAPQVATRSFGNSRATFGGHAPHDSHGHDDHGHGHGHHDEPHVPEFYDKLGRGCLIFAYLWIFYRIKEDKGQLFGLYKPWLDEHHHEHIEYHLEEVGTMPLLVTHDDHDHEEEDDE
jgi:hypothetical protein